MAPLVLKFGGTSVKNISRIHHVAEIIQQRLCEGPIVAVVSAMGDTTDHLLQLARNCASYPNQREVDQLLATGEQVSVSLLSLALSAAGIKAISLTAAQAGIACDGTHGNARITHIDPAAISQFFETYDVVVVAGFQGITTHGDIATLGRGGSDTTAVAIAAALRSPQCEIYTDVDGVFTADPNVIPSARLIDHAHARYILRLARLGAQVLHPRSVELAAQHGVDVIVRNTFKPNFAGTLITSGENEIMEKSDKVQAIAVKKRQARICFALDSSSALAGLLKELANKSLTLDHLQITQTEAKTIALGYTDRSLAVEVVRFLTEYGAIIELPTQRDFALVSLVGLGVADHYATVAAGLDIAQENAVGLNGLIKTERDLSLVVFEEDANKLAKSLHERFIETAQLRQETCIA